MNRQRGIFALGLIGSVIAYAVMAGVVVGVLAGVNAGLKSHYVAPEKAKWDKEKGALVADNNTLKANQATCLAANVTLKRDHDQFVADHNKGVQDAKDESDRQKARRVAAEKAAAPKLADLAMEKFNRIAALGKPDGGISCDQMDTLLLDTAKRRAKFYGEEPVVPTTPAGALNLRVPAPAPAERPKAVNPLVRPK